MLVMIAFAASHAVNIIANVTVMPTKVDKNIEKPVMNINTINSTSRAECCDRPNLSSL